MDSTFTTAIVSTYNCIVHYYVNSYSKVDPHIRNTILHCSRPTNLSISQFISRVGSYFKCSNECFLLSLIYIDRLLSKNNFILNTYSVYRVVLTSMVLAAKFFDDVYYNDSYYGGIGGITVDDLNVLEIVFLKYIDFELYVSPLDYYNLYQKLVYHSKHICCKCGQYSFPRLQVIGSLAEYPQLEYFSIRNLTLDQSPSSFLFKELYLNSPSNCTTDYCNPTVSDSMDPLDFASPQLSTLFAKNNVLSLDNAPLVQCNNNLGYSNYVNNSNEYTVGSSSSSSSSSSSNGGNNAYNYNINSNYHNHDNIPNTMYGNCNELAMGNSDNGMFYNYSSNGGSNTTSGISSVYCNNSSSSSNSYPSMVHKEMYLRDLDCRFASMAHSSIPLNANSYPSQPIFFVMPRSNSRVFSNESMYPPPQTSVWPSNPLPVSLALSSVGYSAEQPSIPLPPNDPFLHLEAYGMSRIGMSQPLGRAASPPQSHPSSYPNFAPANNYNGMMCGNRLSGCSMSSGLSGGCSNGCGCGCGCGGGCCNGSVQPVNPLPLPYPQGPPIHSYESMYEPSFEHMRESCGSVSEIWDLEPLKQYQRTCAPSSQSLKMSARNDNVLSSFLTDRLNTNSYASAQIIL